MCSSDSLWNLSLTKCSEQGPTFPKCTFLASSPFRPLRWGWFPNRFILDVCFGCPRFLADRGFLIVYDLRVIGWNSYPFHTWWVVHQDLVGACLLIVSGPVSLDSQNLHYVFTFCIFCHVFCTTLFLLTLACPLNSPQRSLFKAVSKQLYWWVEAIRILLHSSTHTFECESTDPGSLE